MLLFMLAGFVAVPANAQPYTFAYYRLPVAIEKRAAIVPYTPVVELRDPNRLVLRIEADLSEVGALLVDTVAAKLRDLQRYCGESYTPKGSSIVVTNDGTELRTVVHVEQWQCTTVSTRECKGLICRPVVEEKRIKINEGRSGQITSVVVARRTSNEGTRKTPVTHNVDFVVAGSSQDDKWLRMTLEPRLQQDELLGSALRSVVDGLSASVAVRSVLPGEQIDAIMRQLKATTFEPSAGTFGLRLEGVLEVNAEAFEAVRKYLSGANQQMQAPR